MALKPIGMTRPDEGIVGRDNHRLRLKKVFDLDIGTKQETT
jgi:hypothetical protein